VASLNEAYVGTEREMALIRNFLAASRLTRPHTLKEHTQLNEARENRTLIDWPLFDEIIGAGLAHFKQYSDRVELIPEDRYMIARPPSGSDNIGGFYGEPLGELKTPGGYYSNQDIGFATILNPEILQDRTLRTVELARGYLHDCLHATTFRTFRVNAGSDAIYRHQYGINFRTAQGVGYSSPKLTEQSPVGINLNTWMDAAITLSVADFLKDRYADKLDLQTADLLAKTIAQEVLGLEFKPGILPSLADKFIPDVTEPSLKFENFWDKGTPGRLRSIVLHAMFTGELNPIKTYFGHITGQPDAWERIFKQDGYTDPPRNNHEAEHVSAPHSAVMKASLGINSDPSKLGAG